MGNGFLLVILQCNICRKHYRQVNTLFILEEALCIALVQRIANLLQGLQIQSCNRLVKRQGKQSLLHPKEIPCLVT